MQAWTYKYSHFNIEAVNKDQHTRKYEIQCKSGKWVCLYKLTIYVCRLLCCHLLWPISRALPCLMTSPMLLTWWPPWLLRSPGWLLTLKTLLLISCRWSAQEEGQLQVRQLIRDTLLKKALLVTFSDDTCVFVPSHPSCFMNGINPMEDCWWQLHSS